MNYNSFYNKPTLNHKELIGDNKASDIGGMTEEDMLELLETDLTPYYSKDDIDDLFSRSFVYREKSGSIVTFDCPITSQSIPEVTVGIEPVQSGSGDPSPENIRPISGWTEVNLYRSQYNLIDQNTLLKASGWAYSEDEGFVTYGGQQVYKGTIRSLYDKFSSRTKMIPIKCEENEQYVIGFWWRSYNATTNNGLKIIAFYSDGTEDIHESQNANQTWTLQTMTTRANKTLVGIGFTYNSSYTIYMSGFMCMKLIQYNQQPTDFICPNDKNNIVSIQFTVNGETKTIYNGYVEITNGKVKAVATYGYKTVGDLTWTYVTSGQYPYFGAKIDEMNRGSTDIIIMCSGYKPISGKTGGAFRDNDFDKCIANLTNTSSVNIGIQDITYNDADAFKTAMASVQIAYELATPIEYDLADVSISTQDGTNNIWTDSGNIEVKCLDRIIPAGE